MSMNPEIKAQWLARLRSGEVRQTQGELGRWHNSPEPPLRCCLGVLCDLAVEAEIITARNRGEEGMTYDGSTSVLPQRVADWAGLTGPSGTDPEVTVEGHEDGETTLANMNDGGYTFTEIAAVIEEQL